jgi:hypothetical protein
MNGPLSPNNAGSKASLVNNGDRSGKMSIVGGNGGVASWIEKLGEFQLKP